VVLRPSGQATRSHSSQSEEMIRKTHQKTFTLYTGLALLVGLLFITSMFIGPSTLSINAVWAALVAPDQSPSAIIVNQIRLPRTILAALVGATLGLAGATLQGLLRNPLAEPGIIGASSGAALGASLVLYFGLAEISILALPIAGMIGALIAVAMLFLLAGRNASPLALILSGVAISSFASALTALAINLASSAYAALEITFWLMGSLTDRSMTHVALAAPAMGVGWVLMLSGARSLSILSLGEDTASSLGVSLNTLRVRLVLGIAIAVGAAVSISGAIGFVGLIVPHILRPFVGFEPGRLLGVSLLGGSALVIAADIAVRLLSTGIEIRLGVVTSLIGAPFFLFLLLKLRRGTI
jgi:iron complex transport system permease protein